MTMVIWWIEFNIKYNEECECNEAYIVGNNHYDDDKLSSVVEEVEDNFKVRVIL